jgi:hypothetical protein
MQKTHQDNLDFLVSQLKDKPIMAAKFKQILEFQDKYKREVEFVFPNIKTMIDFSVVDEWKKNNPEKTKEIEELWEKHWKGKPMPCPNNYFANYIDNGWLGVIKDFSNVIFS